MYIDTEDTFDARRLSEVLCTRFPERYAASAVADTGSDAPAARDDGAATVAARHAALLRALDRVTVYREGTMEAVVARLCGLDGELVRHDVRLLVVDSVAAPARRQFDHRESGAMAARSEQLARQASALKVLAETFRLPVVVTNQVTAAVGSGARRGGGDGSGVSRGGGVSGGGGGASPAYATTDVDDELLPALGTTWAHCVSNRFLLTDGWTGGRTDRGAGRGVLAVLKSPCAPNVRVRYAITAAGVVGS